MLKVEYGLIGGKGFVALELENGDLEIIKKLSNTSSHFIASNGCGLNYKDIIDGKICLPCSEGEFKIIEIAVNEFNETYLSNSGEEISNLKNELNNLRLENEKLKEKLKEFEEVTEKLKLLV